MSQPAAQVLGVDLSEAFISTAREMQQNGVLLATPLIEGKTEESLELRLPAEEKAVCERAKFRVGDACDMPSDLGRFDAVRCSMISLAHSRSVQILAANLLCRVPQPRLLLDYIASHLNNGGYLLMTSPFSWLEDYTPADCWIGAGGDVVLPRQSSAEALKQELQARGLTV